MGPHALNLEELDENGCVKFLKRLVDDGVLNEEDILNIIDPTQNPNLEINNQLKMTK